MPAAILAPAAPPQEDARRARMAPWNPMDRVSSWYWTGAVTLLALILRMVNVQHPSKIVFDETYYANDAWALLHYGYERNSENNGPGIAAHPPFGKWCIALGEWLFGYNSFGWRFSAALFGSLSVLLIVRVARRLFRSTLLGCTAGALLSLEGLHFVSSRMSLLDIFLLFWVFAAFALLLADRDAMRARLAAALEGGSSLKHGARRSGWREWPWRRLAAAVCLGLALSVKWSALWFVVAFVVLVIVWEIQARRTAGVRHPFLETLGWETPWLLLAGVIILAVYLATWTGWFVTDGGFERHWAEENNASVWYLPDAIVSLWHYQSFIYDFHAHLDAKHAYQSTPMSWLFMERPVLYYAEGGDCGAAECKATISGMGTPLLWWSFVPAWFVCLWQWIVRRDWRAGAIVICAAAGILPWFMYPDRTMFFFYTLPAVPFFVLAVTMALGLVLGREGASQERRAVGAGVYIGYMALIAVCFAYFYPVLTGNSLPIDQWNDRMWMESWK